MHSYLLFICNKVYCITSDDPIFLSNKLEVHAIKFNNRIYLLKWLQTYLYLTVDKNISQIIIYGIIVKLFVSSESLL